MISTGGITALATPPCSAGVTGTLIFYQDHILIPLHVEAFTCCIIVHCIRTRDPYFDVPSSMILKTLSTILFLETISLNLFPSFKTLHSSMFSFFLNYRLFNFNGI